MCDTFNRRHHSVEQERTAAKKEAGHSEPETGQEERPFNPRKGSLSAECWSCTERSVPVVSLPLCPLLPPSPPSDHRCCLSNQLCICVIQLILSPPGGGVLRGGGGAAAAKLRNRRVLPLPGRRRGQGVITGLAARRPTALLKRVGTMNRAPVNQVTSMDTHCRLVNQSQITSSVCTKPHSRLPTTCTHFL